MPTLKPVNSNEFLPPASCAHRRGDSDFVKSQNSDRERMVCAVGLDVHYELNVVAQETGAYQPRLKPFNPRMSGPACPYNYTGKFLDEGSHESLCSDPIALGKKIHDVAPYDTSLYKKHDPRMVSKTVVIRDYGCKIPIDIVNVETIAKAVLNHYPDQYVAFLSEFVSNIFGSSMRKFLEKQRSALKKLLDTPTELNRVSWNAYKSVQGGSACKTNFDAPTSVPSDYQTDCTLRWSDNMSNKLEEVHKSGDTLTGQLSAQDVYDLRPCIRQHVETLTDMINTWCRGFGSKERYVLAMMYYCNEQGRNMSQDLMLLKDSDQPNYENITMHVPMNPFWQQKASGEEKTLSPDMDCSIRGQEMGKRDVYETRSIRYSVGSWTGSADTGNVFIGVAARSPYVWGWGHPANLIINVGQSEKINMCAPFLKYTVTMSSYNDPYTFNISYENEPRCHVEYVDDKRWGRAYTGEGDALTKKYPVVQPGQPRSMVSIRDSLATDDDDRRSLASMYRGSTFRGSEPYRAVLPSSNNYTIENSDGNGAFQQAYTDTTPVQLKCETYEKRPPPKTGPTTKSCGKNSTGVVNSLFTSGCKHVDPFFNNGDNCFSFTSINERPSPDLLVSPIVFGYYDVGKIETDTYLRNIYDRAISDPKFTNVISNNVESVTELVRMFRGNPPRYPYRTVVPPLSFPDQGSPPIIAKKTAIYGLEGQKYAHMTSFIVDMNDVNWKQIEDTKQRVNLSFNDLPVSYNCGYIKHAMRIIALRSILSSSFGMDVAALICEGAIPSHRITDGGVGNFLERKKYTDDGGGTAADVYLKEMVTNYNDQTFQGDVVVGFEDNRYIFEYNGKELSSKEAAEQIYRKMSITMTIRLKWLIQLGEVLAQKKGAQKAVDWRDADEGGADGIRRKLRRHAYEYMTRLILSQTSDHNNTPFAQTTATTHDEFPYELGLQGGTNLNRDPRAFYAFTQREYESQMRMHKTTYGTNIFADAQAPKMTDGGNLSDLMTKVHQTKPNIDNVEEFNTWIDSYLDTMARHVHKILNDATLGTSVVINEYMRLNNPFDNSEPIHRGVLGGAFDPIENVYGRVWGLPAVGSDSKDFDNASEVPDISDPQDRLPPSEYFLADDTTLPSEYAADWAMYQSAILTTKNKDGDFVMYPNWHHDSKSDVQNLLANYEMIRNGTDGNYDILQMPPFRILDRGVFGDEYDDVVGQPDHQRFGTLQEFMEKGQNVKGILDHITIEGIKSNSWWLGRYRDVAKHVVKYILQNVEDADFRKIHAAYGNTANYTLNFSEMDGDVRRAVKAYGELMRSALEERLAEMPYVPNPVENVTSAAQNAASAVVNKLRTSIPALQSVLPDVSIAAASSSATSKIPRTKFTATGDGNDHPEGIFPIREDVETQQSVTILIDHAVSGPVQKTSRTSNGKCKLLMIPIGNTDDSYETFNSPTFLSQAVYNTSITHPQMFAMMDASGLLWHARKYVNPSDCNRPRHDDNGQVDNMHYWCRTMVESFVYAREAYRSKTTSSSWEGAVKAHPASAFNANMIGGVCDDTWKSHFPLLPYDHHVRDDIRRVRALSILWGTLPTYTPTFDMTGSTGAWMPLSVAHQMRLYQSVGWWDEKYRIPMNPWSSHEGRGISLVFNQSYHSVYHTDSYRAPHFQDWLVNASRYQVPYTAKDGCLYPFSQYGGTPVEADFTRHRVERPIHTTNLKRYNQLVYNRFGFTRPLKIGQQYHDTGLLQDMFQFEYRPYADLSSAQRSVPAPNEVFISNFLSYARTHSIIALASCNHGTEDIAVPRAVRNLYRLYVDTYECMGSHPEDDGVPVIMGFVPTAINSKEDRPVTLYAGTLSCLNSKLERFCASPRNSGDAVCASFKQVYLNDATLLYTRMLRQERRKILHTNNYNRAMMKRGTSYTRHQFDRDLIDLQDAYIEFLQTTVLGMLMESGADLNNVPLNMLEPRELEVSMYEEDDNQVGNDFLTPRTREIIKDSDFGGDNLTRTQLAILSLIPPNHRILGTMRLNQTMEVVDLEHARKQIARETAESNKKVWERYSEALISAAFAQKLLEVDGPIDFSLDMSSVKDPMSMKFSMKEFKDPLTESNKIAKRMLSTNAQASSSLSQTQRSERMRKDSGPSSVLGMNTDDLNRALQAVRERVNRDYERQNGYVSKSKCLTLLKVPEHIKRMLRKEYEN